jgi:hypothetical protein
MSAMNRTTYILAACVPNVWIIREYGVYVHSKFYSNNIYCCSELITTGRKLVYYIFKFSRHLMGSKLPSITKTSRKNMEGTSNELKYCQLSRQNST